MENKESIYVAIQTRNRTIKKGEEDMQIKFHEGDQLHASLTHYVHWSRMLASLHVSTS